MSTHSFIGYENPGGTITFAYCHFDGYPEGVGADIINVKYAEAKREVDIGEMRCWAEHYEVGDRSAPETCGSMQAFVEEVKSGPASYGYVCRHDGEWIIVMQGTPLPLQQVLDSRRSVQGR